MILVDTSVWIDHLQAGNAHLVARLELGSVLAHPWVIGELACGNLASRREVLGLLDDLPKAVVGDPREIHEFIEAHQLHGKGLGYVHVHLLASTALTHGARLWTLDRRLRQVAATMGLGAEVPWEPTRTHGHE